MSLMMVRGESGLVGMECGERIRRKRESLGVNRHQLACFLGVSWQTLKTWEEGNIPFRCQARFAWKLERFLAGEFDSVLPNGLPMPAEDLQIPSELAAVFRKMRRVYQFCEESPSTRSQMLSLLKQRARTTLARLAQEKRNDAKHRPSHKPS